MNQIRQKAWEKRKFETPYDQYQFERHCQKNNLVKLRGVDRFITQLLEQVRPIRRKMGDEWALNFILQYCKDQLERNKKYRKCCNDALDPKSTMTLDEKGDLDESN
tara:strand:+ start:1938 stop:2255 length:318 start_codon:yes stop_codon:yes gene_type:complete